MGNPWLDRKFTVRTPNEFNRHNLELINEAGKQYAQTLSEVCSNSHELSLALRKVEESVMWAEQSILRS